MLKLNADIISAAHTSQSVSQSVNVQDPILIESEVTD